jgi:DNA repair exonuclease SbcCD nuclease subunit
LQEREEDIYEVFEEAIDKSILEHADVVILAGDIFHTPRPTGSSIIKLANELKKLKEKSIPVFFVLGEHDINRIQDVPVPYIFHNLRLATRLNENQPLRYRNITIFGFDKQRKSNIQNLLEQFRITQQLAKQQKKDAGGGPNNKNILVLHQGLIDFNKFAGELNSSDLPKGFDYYAMGHYHDHIEKKFDYLDGLISYPGSLDLTPSEGIKEVDKGFCLTDTSGQEVRINWIRLEKRRPQFSVKIDYKLLEENLVDIVKKTRHYEKKPIILLKIAGKEIDSKTIASHLTKLNSSCLHYVWQQLENYITSPLSYGNKPFDIDDELYKLSTEALKSEYLASLAIKEILPLAGRGDSKETSDLLWKIYNDIKAYGGELKL